MNTAFNLPPAKRDGELLDTATANKLIEAVNRLAAIQVQTVRASGMVKSGLMISKENAVLALAYRDAANVLGTAATIDIVTPYSGRRGLRVRNGRGGSGGTVIVNDDGTVDVIPPERFSFGNGSLKPALGIKYKRNGSWNGVASAQIKIDGDWIALADYLNCTGATAEYRSKTSTYTLCGFSEFSSPSVPPKKYLFNQIIEAFVWCTYASASCTGTAARFQLTMSGTATYTASTCTLATIDYNTRNDTGSCGTPGGGFTTTQRSRLVYDSSFMLLPTDLPTVREVTARPPCYNFSGSNHVTATGSGSETLSSEDTEEDAIARENATTGWDGSPQSIAKSEVRGAGDFDGAYVYVEWRTQVSGLQAGFNYTARAQYGRRTYGSSDPFVDFAIGNVSFTATGGTEYTPWEAVPNESGYETNVVSVEVCFG